MDSSPTGHSFSPHAPFQYTITIIHFFVMSFAVTSCYPFAFTQRSSQHSHKRRLISLSIGVVSVFVGFVTGWFIQYSPTTSSSISIFYSCLTFGLLCLISFDLALEYTNSQLSRLFQQDDSISHQQNHELQSNNTLTRIYWRVYHLPKFIRPSLTWVTLCLGYFYCILGVLVMTSTCESLDQCWLPLATGTGFVFSGSLALLHLAGILCLPRHCAPEYYEAIWIIVWGCLSFIWWDASVLGSSWKGIDFGLLWTTGGLLSLVMTFQTWLPFFQKRNVVNSIIICLTGKGILSGHSEDDLYAMNLQVTLAYILIIGSAAKFTQIMLRKTTTDNLPRLCSRLFGANAENCDDDDASVNDLDIGQRSTDYESTYRQLTGMNPSSSSSPCKHQSVYASITMVCGLLSCFTTISGGLFFIGAIVEWVETMQYYISDSTTYVNVLLAMAFLWISYLMILCSIYKYSTEPTNGYDYLGVTTDDYCELPVSTKSSPVPSASNFDAHNTTAMMTTPTSSTSTTYDPTAHQPIPLGMLGTAITKQHASVASTTSACNKPTTSPPPMRPSQLRAKRRSLLISTSTHHHDNGNSKRGSRTLSLSSHTGVGGVLPDDIIIYGEHYVSSPILSTTSDQPLPVKQHHNSNPHVLQHQQQQQQECYSPTFEHHSWQSGTSSTISSSPPPPPHTSLSTSSNEKIGQMNEDDGSTEQQNWTVHKTESGKRKERQWKKSKRRRAAATRTTNRYTPNTDNQIDDGHSPSDGSGDPDQSVYCSSDRHSSDSHV
ncbi:hypothetical protein BCR42DRAFT_448093 [Absidia repens]|uniref:Protein YTP1-like C-terminal domain-containing protein n=1 Tax=Absidia repens TaxID=90262 RepID=A0A1X2IRU3_9FUNG|nr:hypothetical protein BCR42DRAFT_448093 [Absidia repens]